MKLENDALIILILFDENTATMLLLYLLSIFNPMLMSCLRAPYSTSFSLRIFYACKLKVQLTSNENSSNESYKQVSNFSCKIRI